MRALYTFTIFLSAALLFLVEPMVARMILPIFGGSAQVWNSCLVFFQGVLLLGYGYAHLSTKWLGPRHQWRLHLPLMVAAAAYLFWQGFKTPTAVASTGDPSIPLLGLLASLIGLPFLMVSAGSSILQRWFASTNDPDAQNPYFLYSASNIGSLLALLAYPLLLEPKLGIRAQTHLWQFGLIALIVAMTACALALAVSGGRGVAKGTNPVGAGATDEMDTRVAPKDDDESGPTYETPLGLGEASSFSAAVPEVSPPTPTANDRIRWTVLAAIPSSLLLGVTTYLSTNIAPIPLLWVVPLSLYLLTFIFAFARRPLVRTEWLGRLVPLIITPLALAIILESTEPIVPLAILHLLGFFVAGWMCHATLNDSKPKADHLTEYYFWIAFGGVLGGIFNALVAPLVFHTLAEYPIGLVAACLVRPVVALDPKRVERLRSTVKKAIDLGVPKERVERLFPQLISQRRFSTMDAGYPVAVSLATLGIITFVKLQGYEPSALRTMACIGLPAIACFFAVDRPIRFALSLGGLFLVTGAMHIATDGSVVVSERSFFGVHRVTQYSGGRFYRLTHGNTIHGLQDREHPRTPLTYYYPNGPIGQAFKAFSGEDKKDQVALVGLGVGSLAAYGEPGQHMDYFEIDPVVKQIATDPRYFTFVRDSKADVKIIMGDARLSLAQAPDHKYGMIVLDAFSSDAIPVHLLTEEAFRMYLQKLAPNGIICAHISNRFLDLSIVLGAVARDLGLQTIENDDGASDEEKALGKQPSKWVYLAKDNDDFNGLETAGSSIEVDATTPAWTDDFSNVLSVFRPGQ